jgi:hypothetical protein
MPVAQFSLPKRPALVVSISGESSCGGPAAANGALCRISAGDYLDLRSHDSPILTRRPPKERASPEATERAHSENLCLLHGGPLAKTQ